MKPVKKKSGLSFWPVFGLCLAFFAAGLSIPLLMNQSSDAGLHKLETVYNILRSQWYYADEVEDDQLVEQAISGMADLEIDPHTNYFNLEQASAFSSTLAGSSVGLGISYYFNEDGYLTVRNVYINSTADQAGIQAGDVILNAAGLDTKNISSEELVQTIQSYDGQSMEVTILRDGAKQILEVTPGSFDSTVICTLNGDVGEVVLSSFSEDSGKDFADALKRLKEAGATKLILDLRNNGGGYLSAAQAIASSLLPENSLIFLEDTKSGTNELYTSDDYEQVEFDEIVILQNQNSASASEVLIGALKDNLGDKVKTVGTTTYGKGTEQVSIPFSDGTSLKVTIAEWRTPNGTSINNTGFEPDYAVQASAIRSVSYMAMEEEDVILPDTVHVNAKALQMYLSYLGYDADRQDNYFSQASSQALAQFQEDQGLEATGNADAVTWQHLLDAVSVKLNENEKDEDVQRQQALDLLAG